MSLEACPEAIRRLENEDGSFEYFSDDHVRIGCGIWAMDVLGQGSEADWMSKGGAVHRLRLFF